MLSLENTYAKLPEAFFEKINPEPVKKAELVKINYDLIDELGLDKKFFKSKEAVEILAGNKILASSEPIAQAYAGHQFGHFVPQFGDGRAVLLGEFIDKSGARRDMQLKGSGQTRFSRAGDGRAAIGPMLREYIISEALHHLGIPSTRSLSIVKTGEKVYRERPLDGAILCRVASSHIRVGTFEYFVARGDNESLKTLTDYVIDRHYLEIEKDENKYFNLIKAVAEKQASLVSKWMNFGFIHGVMNTDNMSISGESIDFGPCAFMNFYNPATVFSSIDHYGRYAYANQGHIAKWNINCFASTLLNLLAPDENTAKNLVMEAIEFFQDKFAKSLRTGILEKLGLKEDSDENRKLLLQLFELMEMERADFTLSFRYLSDICEELAQNPKLEEAKSKKKFCDLFENDEQAQNWLQNWSSELDLNQAEAISQSMSKVNPLFIARNHNVEKAIEHARRENDFSEFEKLISILSKPYEKQNNYIDYSLPPESKEENYQTFCGT